MSRQLGRVGLTHFIDFRDHSKRPTRKRQIISRTVQDFSSLITGVGDKEQFREMERSQLPKLYQDPVLFYLKEMDHIIHNVFVESDENHIEKPDIEFLIQVINLESLDETKLRENKLRQTQAQAALLVARSKKKSKELIQALEKLVPKLAEDKRFYIRQETNNQTQTSQPESLVFYQVLAAPSNNGLDYKEDFNVFNCLVASLYIAYKNIGKIRLADELIQKYPPIDEDIVRYYESSYGRLNISI